jgi:hypothetical protein
MKDRIYHDDDSSSDWDSDDVSFLNCYKKLHIFHSMYICINMSCHNIYDDKFIDRKRNFAFPLHRIIIKLN